MKTIVTIGILSACLAGCTSPRLDTKPWHTSPSADPRSSQLYFVAQWSAVQKLGPGMSAEQAEALVDDLQWYAHPVNAIVFTEYRGREYEVALKLSKDKKTIEGISYKPRNGASQNTH